MELAIVNPGLADKLVCSNTDNIFVSSEIIPGISLSCFVLFEYFSCICLFISFYFILLIALICSVFDLRLEDEEIQDISWKHTPNLKDQGHRILIKHEKVTFSSLLRLRYDVVDLISRKNNRNVMQCSRC